MHSRCGSPGCLGVASERRVGVSRRHRRSRKSWPSSGAILELHSWHRRADGRRTRSLHGVQCRPPRCVQVDTVNSLGNGTSLGTASAVGITGSDLFIHCLALERPGTPVENPRQTPAWQYFSPVRSAAPCFSRATIVDLAGRRHAADWRHGQRRRRGFTARRQVRRAGRGDAAEPRGARSDGGRESSATLRARCTASSICASMSRRPRTPNVSRESSSNRCPRARTIASSSRRSAAGSCWWKSRALRSSNRRASGFPPRRRSRQR